MIRQLVRRKPNYFQTISQSIYCQCSIKERVQEYIDIINVLTLNCYHVELVKLEI